MSQKNSAYKKSQVLQAEIQGAVEMIDETTGCRNKNIDFA